MREGAEGSAAAAVSAVVGEGVVGGGVGEICVEPTAAAGPWRRHLLELLVASVQRCHRRKHRLAGSRRRSLHERISGCRHAWLAVILFLLVRGLWLSS